MSTKSDVKELPPELARLQGRFEAWRRTRKRRRIPERLWLEAGDAAAVHGVSQTALALRLNAQALRVRMPAATAPQIEPRSSGVGFVEFAAMPLAGDCGGYVLELESACGARLRLEVRGTGGVDVAALARSFVRSDQ